MPLSSGNVSMHSSDPIWRGIDAVLFLWLLWAALPRAFFIAEDAPPAGGGATTWDGIVLELKNLYPDRDSVQANYQKVARRLLAFAEDRDAGSADGDRARLLAAEVFFLGGAPNEARRLI